MGNFLKDLADSQVAVDKILDHLIDSGWVAHELEGKREQKCGDVCYYPEGELDNPINLEIKYDKMSARTGNMCFEVANNTGMTGICRTKADKIIYVLPGKPHMAYVFDPERLKTYLFDTKNSSKVKIKPGGDGKRFTLALVKIDTIISDEVCEEVWTLDD